MRLLEAAVEYRADAVRLTGVIERHTRERVPLYIDYGVDDASFAARPADALAAALLVPSMQAGEPLEIVPPISARLRFSLPRIRDVLHTWWPEFARIPITSYEAPPDGNARPPRAASFFSGGVDSFYSLLRQRHDPSVPVPLTHIVFMRGVETRLHYARRVSESQDWAREVAAHCGVGFISGESNLRTSLQGRLHWENHYYGSALAAIALGLSGGMSYVCIPSGYTYNHLIPHGSTPLVDEMYSTEHVQVVHDGAGTTRARKLQRILEWDAELVLSHLRVCIDNRGGPFNCGKCYKCVRTAVPLKILGMWERARTFPDKSTGHWERSIARDHYALAAENLQLAREVGADRDVTTLLVRGLAHRRRKDKARQILSTPPLHHLLPVVVGARRLLQRR